MEQREYRSYNFDLDTNKLKKHFKNYTDAYKVLKKSFKEYGFEHRQGSGYISKEKLTTSESSIIIVLLNKDNPWLADCTKRFDITTIDGELDAKDLMRNFSFEDVDMAKFPKYIADKLVSYRQDSTLRSEIAAVQTLNEILDRPTKTVSKVNTAKNNKASDTAAKRIKKSKGNGKA